LFFLVLHRCGLFPRRARGAQWGAICFCEADETIVAIVAGLAAEPLNELHSPAMIRRLRLRLI
jgi:hypothetical protein